MTDRLLLPLLLAGLAVGVSAVVPSPAAGPAEASRVAQLIEQLGSASFAERERATEELDAVGVPALEALRKAAASDDPEVRRRAGELLRKVEARAEAEKVLRPTRVRLACKDAPVAEAVEALRKQSGF